MKKLLKTIVLVMLACALLLTTLSGCASKGKKLMELDGEKMSVNTVMLLMSRMKGKLASAYAFGADALKDSFWDTVMDASTGMTYDEYYTDMVLENARTYIAALYLFEELELELPDSILDEIDSELKELVDNDGEGSKSYLNTILADFGANYSILRDAFIMEAKIAYLNDYLFGKNGSLISAENYENYYQKNYVRFRQIFFFTTKPLYEKDSNGDVIYYYKATLNDKIVAYDTKREGAYKKEADGAVVKDENGQPIWVYDKDGVQHISYDKKGTDENPTVPSTVLDKNGKVITEALDKDELIALSDKVQMIMEDEAREGEYKVFDALVEEYGEDQGMTQYPNGYYLTELSDYDSPEVVEALFEMKEGEIRRVESDYGIHIVMKYELDAGGYAKDENSDFFITEDGTYSFMSSLKNDLLEQYLEKYKADIVIDEERRKALSMKNVGANYNY